MDKQLHTPEPWFKEDERIFGADGFKALDELAISAAYFRGDMGKDHWSTTEGAYIERDDDEVAANCRRVVACVNACAGIPTDSLEFMYISDETPIKAIGRLRTEANEAWKQRDELLDALKKAEHRLRHCRYSELPLADKLAVIIAKAESQS